MQPNTKPDIYLKHYEIFLCVTMYLMCGPRQLFFQYGPEMPKGWTPTVLLNPGGNDDIGKDILLKKILLEKLSENSDLFNMGAGIKRPNL